ncbi:MAG: permease-like cell division protein FtsX, partial [Clostridia bacterium]|nr:permease-like cell division protein FtsX [Clostridia bacterium]
MKIQSIKYLTREGFRNVWVNRLMSIASVGVLVACMVLIGFAILLTENVNVYMSNLEQQNVVMVYFNDENSVIYQNASQIEATSSETDSSDESSDKTSSDSTSSEKDGEQPKIPESAYLIHNEEEALEVCAELEKIANVSSVEFISKEQALENAKETALSDMAGAFAILDEEGGNPMSHGARVTLEKMELFEQTIKNIEKTTGVHSVVSHAELAKTIADIKSGISMICFWIIGILGIIALVIVSNTIRVTMYNRKLEISIMKAVGATDAFVRLPFVVEGIVLGLISAILSEGILYFCYRVA